MANGADLPANDTGPAVSGFVVVGVFAAGALGALLIFLAYASFVRDSLSLAVAPARLDLVAGTLSYACFLAACWLLAVRPNMAGWQRVGLRRCAPSLVLLGGFLAAIWVAVTTILYAAFGLWEEALAGGAHLIGPFKRDAVALAGLFLLAGPVAAIVEEVLFRGLLYGWLRRRLKAAGAAFVSALIFTVAHAYVFVAGIPAALDMLALAVLLALLYEFGGSLWPGILCHAMNNMLVLGLYLHRA